MASGRFRPLAPITAFYLFAINLPLVAFGDATHKNLPEDALLYMEISGSNQQRWVADYIKAKTGGRYAGTCVNINYHPGQTGLDNTQCGAHGIMRVAGVKPDYFRESFWNILTGFGWGPPQVSLLSGQNFSAWYHFINLMEKNTDNKHIVSGNYNFFDGYSPNALFSNFEMGYDWLITVGMNNAQMSVDLPGCTDSACAERSAIATGVVVNPATDYRQNGSSTPVSAGVGSQKLEGQDGTNYNCFSDTAIIGACPDEGSKAYGWYQYPNVRPGGGGYDPISLFTNNEDWVIYEPSYNAATFYYNELWLEGLASRNSTLETWAASGRYYSVVGPEVLLYGVVHHYADDATQITHIWPTQSYNHLDYESFVNDHYGKRQIGLGTTQNWEDHEQVSGYLNARQNRYVGPPGNIHRLILEQAFMTYHIRGRSGFDKMTTTDHNVWENAARWAVNNSLAVNVLINEKAVLDLRKCRNSAMCDNI